MRVLIASWSARQVGGTETYIARIAALLAAAGCEVAFAHEVDEPRDRPSIALPDGSKRLTLTSDLRGVRDWRPDVVYAHGILDPAIESALLDIAPAVYFAHSYYGTCISGDKTNRLPVVQPCTRRFGAACLAHFYPHRCGGLSPVTMVRDYARQRRRLALLARYAAAVTHTGHMREELLRHGAAGGRVFTVGFATGETAAVPLMPRPQSDVTTIVFAGRMDRLKGGDYLLRALPATSAAAGPLHVTMIGDGPERAAWERLAREVTASTVATRVDVRFTGWLDRERIAAELDRADLLAVPSVWPEPFGLVGIEANRRGVPAVAFAVGGIPEWLHDGVNGCLAPGNPPTVEGFAAALLRAIPSLRQSDALRQGALRTSGAMSDQAHLTALLDVFARVSRPSARLESR